jgi:hypothetical protein
MSRLKVTHSEMTDFQPVPKDFDKCDDCTEFRCVKENALAYCPILTEEAERLLESEKLSYQPFSSPQNNIQYQERQ